MKSSDETHERRCTIKGRQQQNDRWMSLASAIIGGWVVAGMAGTVIAVCFSKSEAHPDVWGIDWHGVRAFFVMIASGWLAGRHIYRSELGDRWDRHEAESVPGAPRVDDPREWRVMCMTLLVGIGVTALMIPCVARVMLGWREPYRWKLELQEDPRAVLIVSAATGWLVGTCLSRRRELRWRVSRKQEAGRLYRET